MIFEMPCYRNTMLTPSYDRELLTLLKEPAAQGLIEVNHEPPA
jgi:hypothetical protein